MEAASTIEEIVRGLFLREEEEIDLYDLCTTSPIKVIWPDSTPATPPRRSPNTTSPSAATSRKPTPREGNSA